MNPKLSLPTDLPYKKRQRPFNANSALQQATVRYNEALRKQYNNIQFAKRYENGCVSQNELTSVNTVDIAKEIDPNLFKEMSNFNPLPGTKQKKVKQRIEIQPSHPDENNISIICNNNSIDEYSPVPKPNPIEDAHPPYDCNNNEHFPQLTIESSSSYFGKYKNPRSSPSPNPEQFQSLEVQAMHQYEPTIDSAHDMIFGNVMGIDYGNYVHGHLWPSPECHQQQQQQFNGQLPIHLFNPNPIPCTTSRSVGYNLQSGTRDEIDGGNEGQIENGHISGAPLCSSAVTGNGSSRRSTSVPRPKTRSRKETLKQAAIRCGIIKGKQAKSVVPTRSHYLVPLQLAAAPSDPLVPVVDILHPRPLIPTCSSENLLEEMKCVIADADVKKDEVYYTTDSDFDVIMASTQMENRKCFGGKDSVGTIINLRSHSDNCKQLPIHD